ncbi:hypothetical protein [Actinoplanes rectilineatus]|uniref:hypothetical protein n=1 Tax=Actinoplanes rectilineatus TaxID=113571 RepID=UPI0005F2A300|nr:hypothetical protein [Actinoplanes rectilineatus]
MLKISRRPGTPTRWGGLLRNVLLAVVLGAACGSTAAAVSWQATAAEIPGEAWGRQLAADLFPEARTVRIDLIPGIAGYEDAEVQSRRFGFLLFGGDDYFPGQLIVTAQVASPRDVIAHVGPGLRAAGWTVDRHDPGEDVTATMPGRTLWVTQLYPDEVEVSVYRQTPRAVLRATGTAWLLGALAGFLLGSRIRGAEPLFLLGLALSAPAAFVASAGIGAQVFTAGDRYPFIPWDIYMYALFRPAAILGCCALGISALVSGFSTAVGCRPRR